MEDILEELLQHRAPDALQQCLRKVRAPGEGADQRGQACLWALAESASVLPLKKWGPAWACCAPAHGAEYLFVAFAPAQALSNSLHPLGKLLRTLMLTFQATYSGIGANKHLQGLAQEEVKQHAQELWAAYR